MAYGKISIDRAIAADSTLNIGAMTAEAVRDHALANGCEFEDDAAARAVAMLGLDPDESAAELPEEVRVKLGLALEALETNCTHKS